MRVRLEEEIEGIGCLTVLREGRCDSYTWTVTWSCRGGDKNELEVYREDLKGGNVSISVVTTQDGGIMFGPLESEFLHVAATTPQVKYFELLIEGSFSPQKGLKF